MIAHLGQSLEDIHKFSRVSDDSANILAPDATPSCDTNLQEETFPDPEAQIGIMTSLDESSSSISSKCTCLDCLKLFKSANHDEAFLLARKDGNMIHCPRNAIGPSRETIATHTICTTRMIMRSAISWRNAQTRVLHVNRTTANSLRSVNLTFGAITELSIALLLRGSRARCFGASIVVATVSRARTSLPATTKTCIRENLAAASLYDLYSLLCLLSLPFSQRQQSPKLISRTTCSELPFWRKRGR